MIQRNNAKARMFSGVMRGWSVLIGSLLLVVLGLAASAQQPDKPDPKKSPPSFSNKDQKTDKKPTSKTPAKPVDQQDMADAVLGDALNKMWDQADEHYHQGEYNHIINLCNLIVQGDPHNVEAYADSAYLLWSTDRSDQAVAVLKRGIAANPNTYYMYDELGTHYLVNLKDPKDAQPYLEKAVQFPSPFTTWHNLAFCYEKTGQWEKAVKAWEKAATYEDVDRSVRDNTLRHLRNAKQELAKHA